MNGRLKKIKYIIIVFAMVIFAVNYRVAEGTSSEEYEYILEDWTLSEEKYRDGIIRKKVVNDKGEVSYGLVDKEGQYIIPPVYTQIIGIESGHYFGGTEDGYYYISKTSGDEYLEGVYDIRYRCLSEPRFREVALCDRNGYNLVPVSNNSFLWGYLDTSTATLHIPFTYIRAGNFADGCAKGYKDFNGVIRAVIIYPDGSEFILPTYLYWGFSDYSNGLAVVRNNDELYGYIDSKGEIVVQCVYQYAEPFDGQYIVVLENDEWLKVDISAVTR